MSSSRDEIRAAYDLACEAYARKFIDELSGKPRDLELLQQFSTVIGPGRPVLDLGCGPGHTTAHLTSLGLQATGVDLSPGMIAQARRLFPQSQFIVGDLFDLPHESGTVAGILAFYCIVHLTPDQLLPAFSETFRVLSRGGVLLLSFHAGAEVIRVESFLETGAALEFSFFEPADIQASLMKAGFEVTEGCIREPYAVEHPSRRCYLFASKP